jgi:hypothetical protein
MLFAAIAGVASADELLYTYECDLPPPQADPAWIIADPCEGSCIESAQNGYLIFLWPEGADKVTYAYRIAVPGQTAPETLWVEWQFRSNHSIGPIFWTCDGSFLFQHGAIGESVQMYGNEAVSGEGGDYISGLALNEFHSYRFESLDAVNYRISANGQVFIEDTGNRQPNGYHTIQFSGRGGCTGDTIPNQENAWDFVRFGTISHGEPIVTSDPPRGFLDARQHAGVDRITITYDSPNYVYVDEITVQVFPPFDEESQVAPATGDSAIAPSFEAAYSIFDLGPSNFDIPQAIATRRLDNGPPEVVEVVLDRPIPLNATTRFLFDDGVAVNIIDYTFAPADADGDGLFRLSDAAHLQSCFGKTPVEELCGVFDIDSDADVDLDDFATFQLTFEARE